MGATSYVVDRSSDVPFLAIVLTSGEMHHHASLFSCPVSRDVSLHFQNGRNSKSDNSIGFRQATTNGTARRAIDRNDSWNTF
jgi:hypothetical protein